MTEEKRLYFHTKEEVRYAEGLSTAKSSLLLHHMRGPNFVM